MKTRFTNTTDTKNAILLMAIENLEIQEKNLLYKFKEYEEYV